MDAREGVRRVCPGLLWPAPPSHVGRCGFIFADSAGGADRSGSSVRNRGWIRPAHGWRPGVRQLSRDRGEGGRTEVVHRGCSVIGGPGSATVFTPEGLGKGQWDAGSRMICFKIDRSAVDDALSDALGWQVRSQVDFTPVIPTNAARTRSWISMLVSVKQQFFRTDSLLSQPLVGLPSVESLVRGFLLAAERPHLDDKRRTAGCTPRRLYRRRHHRSRSAFAVDAVLDRCP